MAVSSAGWPVNTPLTVTFTDADGNEIGTQPVTTDANGTFSTTFEVPAGTALGTLDITAADGAGRTASAEVEVVADPVITVTPPVAAPGDTITTDGSGYPPNTDV
ncbi:MG2 domain-containing protein, partial [Aeromicrobium camelliae]|uniref:MG2 domain-containing protein n=1 Tax=Aeromicrobium camelliae TaxID=1538144 RepID=UPI001FB6D3D6